MDFYLINHNSSHTLLTNGHRGVRCIDSGSRQSLAHACAGQPHPRNSSGAPAPPVGDTGSALQILGTGWVPGVEEGPLMSS